MPPCNLQSFLIKPDFYTDFYMSSYPLFNNSKIEVLYINEVVVKE